MKRFGRIASVMLLFHLLGATSVDPAIAAKAREWFFRFQTGQIDRRQLNDTVNSELTNDLIVSEEATLKRYGKPSGFNFVRTDPVGGAIGYDFVVTFDSGNRIIEAIAFDKDGKIAGIDFALYDAVRK